MPEPSAASGTGRTVLLPVPRRGSGWSPPRAAPSTTDWPAAVAEPALVTWADQDDGCLVLLEQAAGGELTVRWVSRTGAQVLGYAPEELVGETLDRLLRSPFAAAAAGDHLAQEALVDPRRAVRRSLSIQRRDGAPMRMALTSVPVAGGNGPAWILRLVQEPDVERVADDLRTSHERFRALADRAPIAIFSSESGLRLAYVNDRFTEVYGESAERLSGMGWLSHVHPEDRGPVVDAMTRVLGGSAQDLPLRVVRADGQERSVHARIVPVPNSRRDAGFVGTFEDVTERKAWEASLAYQASHDPLTGLLNRRRLLEVLGEELTRSRMPGSPSPALLFLDLDDFKFVNDSLGHDAGDRLLLEVARRLSEAVREDDVVSRFGGDEFAVLCPGLLDDRGAAEVAQRLLAAVTGPVELGSVTCRVSGSIGVVLAGPGHVEAEDVLRDADVAMYQAKAAGKDCWALFDEQARRAAQHRLDLARDLRQAIEDGALAVHYQPIVQLPGDGAAPVLASVEALARWVHPVHGPVPPSEFIALAEENGLVGDLGTQVLRAACEQMVQWQQALGAAAPPVVAVNVSALQMRQPHFPDVVACVLEQTGLAGEALCLELTETVVMHDTAAAGGTFERLRALGVRIAIDDFGTGYSSLSLLRRLPFDQLKIDRSLLAHVGAQVHDPVVAAVLAMGRALDLDVVAEGVETAEQLVELRRLSCPLAQGFLFGRPVPPQELAAWAVSAAPSASR